MSGYLCISYFSAFYSDYNFCYSFSFRYRKSHCTAMCACDQKDDGVQVFGDFYIRSTWVNCYWRQPRWSDADTASASPRDHWS